VLQGHVSELHSMLNAHIVKGLAKVANFNINAGAAGSVFS